MKRFRFRLQALATLRDLEETRALAALVEARRAFAQARARLLEKQAGLHRMTEFVVQERAHAFHGREQASDLAALDTENRAVETCREEANKLEVHQDQVRSQWVAAHLQTRLLDELRARARQQFHLESRQQEQKEVEELTYMRRGRDVTL